LTSANEGKIAQIMNFETQFLLKLLRWGIYLQEMEKEYPGFEWGKSDHLLLWPIPQNELDVNTKLVQNPGYK
jgi:hypothetical protein